MVETKTDLQDVNLEFWAKKTKIQDVSSVTETELWDVTQNSE